MNRGFLGCVIRMILGLPGLECDSIDLWVCWEHDLNDEWFARSVIGMTSGLLGA